MRTAMNLSKSTPASLFRMEACLLEMFAPKRPHSYGNSLRSTGVWRFDEVHRAKNLAQMAISLAHVSAHSSRGWLTAEAAAQVEELALVYRQLVDQSHGEAPVACETLLQEVVTRLTNTFGAARGISCKVSHERVLLRPDKRRALVLLGSELVINALKYGFSGDRGGRISVILRNAKNGVELAVEDDGIGGIETYTAGYGGELIVQLAAVLDADVKRSEGRGGRGFRVEILIPAAG